MSKTTIICAKIRLDLQQVTRSVNIICYPSYNTGDSLRLDTKREPEFNPAQHFYV